MIPFASCVDNDDLLELILSEISLHDRSKIELSNKIFI